MYRRRMLDPTWGNLKPVLLPPVVWLRTNRFTSLSLSFFIHKNCKQDNNQLPSSSIGRIKQPGKSKLQSVWKTGSFQWKLFGSLKDLSSFNNTYVDVHFLISVIWFFQKACCSSLLQLPSVPKAVSFFPVKMYNIHFCGLWNGKLLPFY